MIDIQTFETIISMPESNQLDFKIEMYDLSRDDAEYSKTSKMVKDIISFINTTRITPSYIIIGIEAHKDGSKTLHGLKEGFDDAIIQDKVKDKINPVPIFETYILFYKEMKFGIIEFPVKPYKTFLSSTIKMKGVEAGVPYYRMNSSNQEAKGHKVIEIANWINSVQFETTKTINDTIKEFKHRINNDINNLSSIIIDLQHFSKQYNFNDLENYCNLELTGFTIDSVFSKKRFVNQIFAHGKYPTTIDIDDIDTILISVEPKELKLFHSISISEIESRIKDSTFRLRRKNYMMIHSSLNEALLKNLPAGEGDKIITRFYTDEI